jgi:GT2 family glycosyltransferase
MKLITLQITTRNRLHDLKESLIKNESIINDFRVHTIVCVDGSTDDSYSYIQNNYPKIELIQNKKSIGLIASRNRMMALTTTDYAVSLDDDAHFLSKHNADTIISYFENQAQCAVIAFRIYWGKDKMEYIEDTELPTRVRGFVGCGHAWRIAHWKHI